VSGSKHRGRFCGGLGCHPPKIFEIVYAKSCNLVHFGQKIVRSAVHNAFLNILTMGTAFPRVSPRNDPVMTRCFCNLLQFFVVSTQAFDHFVANKFATVKRYSGEGAESVLPFYSELFSIAANS